MTNSFLKPLILIVLLIFITCSSTKLQTSRNEDIVSAFITARNNHDIKKVKELIDKNYYEIFIDGTMEIENKEQLVKSILWGKELDSNINLLDMESDGVTVITIEENTNYLDVALKRKSRKFKIVYTFRDNKILNQRIDTLPGYYQVMNFNADRYEEFRNYCEQNNLIHHYDSLNQESGILLRKVLEKYKRDNE